MSFNKYLDTFRFQLKGSAQCAARQFMLVSCAVLFLNACETAQEEEDRGTIGFAKGFIGGVSADEPRAALVGRDVLSSGGNAVDAAVAMYFTMAVTMPSVASIGGGGVCVVHDSESGDTKSLNFLAAKPVNISQSATRPSAIPGNPRGFYALHARYGLLRWEQLVAPAANLARFGTPISRAFGRDLSLVQDHLLPDPGMRAVFSNADGGMVGEGAMLKQVDLSVILGRMVARGPGDFYSGKTARQLVDAVTQAGGSLSMDDLREYRPIWEDTITVSVGDHLAHFPLPPAAAGATAANMLQMLNADDMFANASASERAHLLAESAMYAYADRGRWMLEGGLTRWSSQEISDPTRVLEDLKTYQADQHRAAATLQPAPKEILENPAGTSFIVADNKGGAVACSLSMNNLFGNGKIAQGTGIILSTIPGESGRGPLSMGPMIVVNPYTKRLHWVGASSGGVVAPTSLINVAAQTILAKKSLREVIKDKRIHHGGNPDRTYYEMGMDPDIVQGLKDRGHTMVEAKAIGRVNAMYCFDGLPIAPASCELANDPRAYGLSLISQQ